MSTEKRQPNAGGVTSGTGPGTVHELVITRVFDAPPELVWRAWSECEHLIKWWGPRGYTTPSCRIDFRVGGTYHYCMRSEENVEIWGTGTYLDIVPMKRIYATDSFADERGNIVAATHYGMPANIPLEMRIDVTFEDLDGKTRMVLKHIGLPPGEMSAGASVGWNESFDKLADTLTSL